jgi:hypothetical protein
MFQLFLHFFTGVFEKYIRQFNILICQTAFLGRTFRCENIADPVFRDMGDLEISFMGQSLDERVDQAEGYIQVPGELPLARGVVFFDLFEKMERPYVNGIQFLY